MNDFPITTDNLTKSFDRKTAVDALTMKVPQGSVYGFLGVNGAGKTTTIRMLMGHLHPSCGSAITLGGDPRAHDEQTRRRIAYVCEEMAIPPSMTPEKAVAFNAAIYPQWDGELAQSLLGEFQLTGTGRFDRLSKGQKRKVCILLALCQNAELLIMDEPAAGLDVVARHDFLKRVLEIACQGGRTVFISSHLLSDLERVVDRLAIIDRGRLILEDELERLKAGVRKIHIPAAIDRDVLQGHFDVFRYEQPAESETLVTVTNYSDENLSRLAGEQPKTQNARVFALNLEDMFVELVGKTENSNNTGQ